MKHFMVLVMTIFTCVLFINCNKNQQQIEDSQTNITYFDSNLTSNTIKPLEPIDFSISDIKNTIQLDSPYINFNIDKPEEKLDNNYVGEEYSGEFIYKVFFHKYDDFILYISNKNYNIKNRTCDEFFITQITLNNTNFHTHRGITVGSTKEDIINLYGYGNESIEGIITLLTYSLNDMRMVFTINNEQRVENIIVSIIAVSG